MLNKEGPSETIFETWNFKCLDSGFVYLMESIVCAL